MERVVFRVNNLVDFWSEQNPPSHKRRLINGKHVFFQWLVRAKITGQNPHSFRPSLSLAWPVRTYLFDSNV